MKQLIIWVSAIEKTQKVKLLKPFDVSKISIEKDLYFSEAYVIDLPLESSPDHTWLDIFDHEWKSSRHLWDRKLSVIGDKVRLVTTEHDFKDKLDWVEQIIDQTNKAVEEHRHMLQIAEQQKERATWDDRARIERIREMLRAKFGVQA
jgi:hypothetical protein